ncbi:DUF2254 domain-containing protein [Streptomyces sp. NPDC051310]|uniref:DUF2254 domain-containing protein n=1 Tax=Streptomyces sp. NPDC051310 TaxID=3365649 RepID=UPI0037B8B592
MPESRRPRMLSPLREHLRETFWFAPTAGLVGVFAVWLAAAALDTAIVDELRGRGQYAELGALSTITEDARTIVTTVSQAMMTFIGVVFSISLVAVQMASGQLTPRVVRLFVRRRINKLTLTVFLATFLFSLLVLTSYESETDPQRIVSVPLVQSVVTLLLVALSLLLFIAYVTTMLRLMQVGPVVDRIVREALRVVHRRPAGERHPAGLPPETGRVVHRGRAGVLRDVHVARLVRAAGREGVVLRLIPRVGDYLVPGTPVLAVHGEALPRPGAPAGGPRSGVLRSAVSVGSDRTFHQDLGLGLRQLVDIALRALSPAVNDPTTAVQCLDRIVQFLAVVADRPLGVVHHRDRHGAVRLVEDAPGWEDLVDLAFTELRGAAVAGPQVTRRMLAGIDDLLPLAPEERREPLLRHRALLAHAVEYTAPEPADRAFALEPDRQGIGRSGRRRTRG